VRRRDFITLVGGAVAGWPQITSAQQQDQRIRQLGMLLAYPEGDSIGQQYVAAFVEDLRGLGWIDGRNIRIVYRWTGPDFGRIRSAATELLDLKPDAILTQSGLTLAPLQQLTTNVPIVFVQVADPVGSGFVASMANPGGNITGFALAEFATAGKTLEVLKELVPTINSVTVIYNPVQTPQVGLWHAIEGAAQSLSVRATAVGASDADNLKRVIEDLARETGGGMIVLPNPITTANRRLIIELAAHHRLPTAYLYSYYVHEGGLVSYGSEPIVQYRQAANYVDRIFRGAKPTDLPVQLATDFKLAINLKTARALGITIPQALLSTAGEVVE
jgi:putative ABC transport system substrate-binding protein